MFFFTLVFALLWAYVMCVGLRRVCRSKRGRALAKRLYQPASSSSSDSNDKAETTDTTSGDDELP